MTETGMWYYTLTGGKRIMMWEHVLCKSFNSCKFYIPLEFLFAGKQLLHEQSTINLANSTPTHYINGLTCYESPLCVTLRVATYLYSNRHTPSQFFPNIEYRPSSKNKDHKLPVWHITYSLLCTINVAIKSVTLVSAYLIRTCMIN